MSVYIGKQMENRVVKYISVIWQPAFDMVGPVLRNFYPTEKRVEALLALGNLMVVNGTPHGKWIWCNDIVHCRAMIRDDKEKKGRHEARYVNSEEAFLKLEGHLFLFKDGHWFYYDGETLTSFLPDTLPSKPENPLQGLEFMQLDAKGELGTLYNREFKKWNDILTQSNEEQTTVFVFRGNKLITTINHPQNNQ
jgi:hypothetical protein|nr:MAG TPA: SEC-C motif-c motif containing protein, Structural [Caudoviricetes sp.]